MKEYRLDLDILKGVSIIAVVLYHVGILPYGYLGVDTFLVINGFFILPGLIKAVPKREFSFGAWFVKRMKRFLPIVLITSVVCLAVGFFVMIPDDYENLAESVFASSIFCQNILSAITTGNYWDSVNEYKPLMHFWYLGIVVQFYFVISCIYMIINRLWRIGGGKNVELSKVLNISVVILFILSLILYFCPFSFNFKFYYLPFRIWEFCLGGLVGLLLDKKQLKIPNWFSVLCLFILVLCFCLFPKRISEIDTTTIIGAALSNAPQISKELLVILAVIFSTLLLCKKQTCWCGKFKWLAFLGKMSLSIFVWHQVLLAFGRYFAVDRITIEVFVLFVIVLLVLSYVSYRWIESIEINSKLKWGVTILLWIGVLCTSYSIYLRGGVVRDVPELGIAKGKPLLCRNTEYIDRIYAYDKPFSDSHRKKVLVVGNSFARDFASVLLEWDKKQDLELSYLYSFSIPQDSINTRLAECDYLFYFGAKKNIPAYVWNTIKKNCQVYGISTKSYGKNFGRIYARRHKSDYYESSISLHPLCEQINNEWRKEWGKEHFIDFMEPIRLKNGKIRLFTDDHKIISFDCRHLTMYGCQYYAKLFDFDRIFFPTVK